MRWIDVFSISIKMLRTNLLRSLLTVFAIGTAIGLIVVLVGVGYGVQNITIGSIVHSQSLLSMDVTAGKDGAPALNQAALKTIGQVTGVADLSPVFTVVGQLKVGDNLISNTLEAGDASIQDMEGVKVATGRQFAEGKSEVVVSPQAVQLLGTTPAAIIGKQGSLSFVNPVTQQTEAVPGLVTIVGVSDENTTSLFAPYALFSGLPDVQMTSAKVLAKDRNGVIESQAAMEALGYGVSSLIDTLDSAQQVFGYITWGLVVIAAIALVVAAIGMFNTLTITLLERTREIGIMKSIGITDRTVLRLFLSEAAMIGFLGGLAGIILGLLVSLIIDQIVYHLAIHYGGTAIHIFAWPSFFLLSMLLYPILLAIVTGLYPALRAANLNPLKALRYE
jgi:putative ABC transport system permease protein